VICIAPGYKKYDLFAVEKMGANIELWKYRRFENGMLYLETVNQTASSSSGGGKTPRTSKRGAGDGRASSYTLEQHLEGKPDEIRELVIELQQFILDMDSSIEEAPKKLYVSYRTSQNIVCVEIQKKKLNVFLKLQASDISEPRPSTYRDVTNIGHFGTGDAEFTVSSMEDIEIVTPFIQQSYDALGG
jgi:predicted transport protein